MIFILLILIILFLINFYRKPSSKGIKDNNIIYAASYGTIKDIFIQDGILHIVTYLSPFDVHMQYAPLHGIVKKIEYDRTGKFHLAYKIGKSRLNEKMIHYLQSPKLDIEVVQVAGFLTRHIKSYLSEGQHVETSDPLGFINLGSRVDIRIPADKIKYLMCKIGQTLVGGKTPLLYF